jgi:polyisoprenoid-binding protein YceI
MRRASPFIARFAVCIAVLVVLGGCQPARQSGEPGGFEDEFAWPRGATRYLLDPDETYLDIRVFRAGALASLGHNHVISAGRIDARIGITDPFENSAFELRIPVTELLVDAPDRRAVYGEAFAAPVDAAAIAGTRDNMLGPDQLDAANWPDIIIRSVAIEAAAPDRWRVDTRIMLRGREQRLEIPLETTLTNERVVARADFDVKQSDLGLTPFAVMLGALQVADNLSISIRLSASRAE